MDSVSILDLFREVLNPNTLLNITSESGYKQHTLTLKESDPSAKLKKITITNTPDKSQILCYQTQATHKNNNFFLNVKSDKGFNKSCDAVILYKNGDMVEPVFCEIKSYDPKAVNYEEQLIYSELFNNYLTEIVNILGRTHNIEVNLTGAKFILLHIKKSTQNRIAKELPRAEPYQIQIDEMKNFKGKHIKKIAFLTDSESVKISFSNLINKKPF